MKRIPYKNVVLVGFKGCGKTRVGKLLAKALDYKFLDIDGLIEAAFVKSRGEKASVRTIYKKFGPDFFKQLEGSALVATARSSRAVVSLGGGSPLNPKFRKRNFKGAVFVHLDPPADVLYRRIVKKGIPPFFDKKSPRESFDSLYAAREPVYRRIADVTANNGSHSPTKTCRDILALLEDFYE